MKVKILLYEKTNFDSVNLPDSIDMLMGNYEPFFEDIISITHPLINNVRIKIKFEDVINTDYVIMTDIEHQENYYCFSVNSINYVNDNVCSLDLQLDALTSLGALTKVNVVGFVSRCHIKKEDDVFGNYIIEESFTPNESLKLDVSNQFGQNKENLSSTAILETSVEPIEDKSDVLTPNGSAPHNEVLLVPACRSMSNGVAKLRLEFGEVTINNPNGTYKVNNINTIATTMRKFGVENGIISSYNLPNAYAGKAVDGTISSSYTLIGFSDIGINLFYTNVANKKAFTQFSSIKLLSNCSGNSYEVNNIADILQRDGTEFSLGIFSDPRCNGRPTCYFRYYKGEYQGNKTPLAKCDGMIWQNNPIIYTDKSGSNIEILNITDRQNLRRDTQNTNLAKGVVNTAYNTLANSLLDPSQAKANMMKGVADVGGQVVNYAFDKAILENELNTELKIFNRNLNFQQPQLNFCRNESVRDFYGNGFYIAYTHLSVKDTIRFDTYLTRFGYAVDEEYDPAYLTSRSKFNFIQFSEVDLFCDRPKWLRELAKIQLKNGIRLWHEKPTKEAMERFGNP